MKRAFGFDDAYIWAQEGARARSNGRPLLLPIIYVGTTAATYAAVSEKTARSRVPLMRASAVGNFSPHNQPQTAVS